MNTACYDTYMQSHMCISHLSLQFSFRHQGRNRIHNDDIHDVRSYQMVTYFQRLLPILWLDFNQHEKLALRHFHTWDK